MFKPRPQLESKYTHSKKKINLRSVNQWYSRTLTYNSEATIMLFSTGPRKCNPFAGMECWTFLKQGLQFRGVLKNHISGLLFFSLIIFLSDHRPKLSFFFCLESPSFYCQDCFPFIIKQLQGCYMVIYNEMRFKIILYNH